jgi:hypothetical protein
VNPEEEANMETRDVPTQPAAQRPASSPSAVTTPPAPSPPAPAEPGLPPGSVVVNIQTPSHEQCLAATAKMQQAFHHAPPAPAEPKTTVTPPPAKK